MASKLRQWQARVRVLESWANDPSDNPPPDKPLYIYGETINKLNEAVRTYLLDKEPVAFGNLGDHITGHVEYSYEESANPQLKAKEDGWWRYEMKLIRGRLQKPLLIPPERFGKFEDAVDHFIQFDLIPEKGPDYRSKAIVGKDLRLPLLERILREAEEYPVNDLIQRGWHIIALEYKGEPSITGELMNRKAFFVMGHPEAQAAEITLNAGYYDRQ
jgi:hypothetical protein